MKAANFEMVIFQLSLLVGIPVVKKDVFNRWKDYWTFLMVLAC